MRSLPTNYVGRPGFNFRPGRGLNFAQPSLATLRDRGVRPRSRGAGGHVLPSNIESLMVPPNLKVAPRSLTLSVSREFNPL